MAKTRSATKTELKKKIAETLEGKTQFTWKSDFMYQMLKPKSTITVDNYVFKLRYAPQFDSPFEEDQDTSEPIELNRINMEDFQLLTTSMDYALNAYLLLYPGNKMNGGTRIWLEDKEAEAEAELQKYESVDKVITLISKASEDKLKAVYLSSTGRYPSNTSLSEVKLKIRKLGQDNPNRIIRLFSDKRTEIKYKYNVAVMAGHLVVNGSQTEVRWSGSSDPIVSVAFGENIANKFAEFCLSEEGDLVLQALNERLKE